MEKIQTVEAYIDFMQTHPEITTCPIRRTLNVVGGKWKLFIVLQLFGSERMRFGQLSKGVEGITNTMLSNCLRELEHDKIIKREQFNEIPPHVEYSLTETGRTLSSVLLAMANWGLFHEEEGREMEGVKQ